MGTTAVAGAWLGKRILERMHPVHFRRVVIALMVITGALMIWDQRGYWLP